MSDASEDRTDEIVAGFAAQGVELLRMPQRGGKTSGLNEVVKRARGEIIVFSDANAMYRPDAVRAAGQPFSRPPCGLCRRRSRYYDSETQSEMSEGLYWKYETAIKRLETRVGSVVGGDGAIYAIRGALYVPMAADSLSDFMNPLRIGAGYRCVISLLWRSPTSTRARASEKNSRARYASSIAAGGQRSPCAP